MKPFWHVDSWNSLCGYGAGLSPKVTSTVSTSASRRISTVTVSPAELKPQHPGQASDGGNGNARDAQKHVPSLMPTFEAGPSSTRSVTRTPRPATISNRVASIAPKSPMTTPSQAHRIRLSRLAD